jgi:hypothetical protein
MKTRINIIIRRVIWIKNETLHPQHILLNKGFKLILMNNKQKRSDLKILTN